MPGYEKIESLKNGGSWGKFWWKTCGFERVNNQIEHFILLARVVQAFGHKRCGGESSISPDQWDSGATYAVQQAALDVAETEQNVINRYRPVVRVDNCS